MEKLKKLFPLSFKLANNEKGLLLSIILYAIANPVIGMLISLIAVPLIAIVVGLIVGIITLPLSILMWIIAAFALVISLILLVVGVGAIGLVLVLVLFAVPFILPVTVGAIVDVLLTIFVVTLVSNYVIIGTAISLFRYCGLIPEEAAEQKTAEEAAEE